MVKEQIRKERQVEVGSFLFPYPWFLLILSVISFLKISLPRPTTTWICTATMQLGKSEAKIFSQMVGFSWWWIPWDRIRKKSPTKQIQDYWTSPSPRDLVCFHSVWARKATKPPQPPRALRKAEFCLKPNAAKSLPTSIVRLACLVDLVNKGIQIFATKKKNNRNLSMSHPGCFKDGILILISWFIIITTELGSISSRKKKALFFVAQIRTSYST